MSISTIIFSNSCVTFVAGAQNKRNARVVKEKKKENQTKALLSFTSTHTLSFSHLQGNKGNWLVYICREKCLCVHRKILLRRRASTRALGKHEK